MKFEITCRCEYRVYQPIDAVIGAEIIEIISRYKCVRRTLGDRQWKHRRNQLEQWKVLRIFRAAETIPQP